ncbi:MAG: TolC family protein [Deltaproteobacteria bacterium]|nr:TolC family protein [Deltaproteobacteria bacterium]
MLTPALAPLLPLLLLAAPTPGATDEAELVREARLELVLRVARAHSPDLREVRERAAAAAGRSSGSGSLPEPELQLQLWQQPLSKPFDADAGGMFMVGLRQPLPAPGTRSARHRAAQADAGMAAAAALAREADLLQQARRALAEYALAEQEHAIHLDHMELTSRFTELARASYQEGRLSKQEFLRASAELARVHADIVATAQAGRASRAFLNTLMGRDPDAPLGPPRLDPPAESEFSVEEAEHALAERPELVAAQRAVERSAASLEAAQRSARWPGFMVGADVGYMPMDGTRTYTLMAGMTLPWLWGRRSDEEREASHLLAADQAALDAARRNARLQVRDAKTRLDAAREAYDILDGQVVPQWQQAAQATQAAFASGQAADALAVLDANRGYLQVRLERVRSLARVHGALGDLERAAGHLHGFSEGQEAKKP